MVAVSAPVKKVPLVAFAPGQLPDPPEAVQVVAPVEDQDSVAEPPEAMALGLAVRLTATPCGLTVTVALALADPPEPVQVSVKLVVAFSAAVVLEPLSALEPLHPPEAEHAVALVELQLSVVLAPAEMVVGVALKDTVGGAFEELPLPPPPQAARAKEAAQVPAAKTWRKFACATRARVQSKRNDSLRVIFMVEFFVAKGADSILLMHFPWFSFDARNQPPAGDSAEVAARPKFQCPFDGN